MSDAVTKSLANDAVKYAYAELPHAAIAFTKHCILDWFGLTLAGASEPLSKILVEELAGNTGTNTLIGHGKRAGLIDCTLINGATSHALDFDDTVISMMGHASVAIFPAVLALAEQNKVSGEDVLTAFVAGFDTACRIGLLAHPTHYSTGFHNTGTIGTFGAAVAASRLMKLDEDQTATALGLAGAQAAGMKSMFGTMAKPLQAGKAAANGLLAARLAARGFTANPDVIETAQGFLATQTRHDIRDLEPALPGRLIQENLFKYHAACYFTHSSIEALAQLRDQHVISPDDVKGVVLHVPEGHLSVCDIKEPRTGLETKFSLCHCAALALHGLDTARLDTFTDTNANDPALSRTRSIVDVVGDFPNATATRIELTLKSGETLENMVDVGVPATDLVAQENRLTKKFNTLVEPLVGSNRTKDIQQNILHMESLSSLTPLISLCGSL